MKIRIISRTRGNKYMMKKRRFPKILAHFMIFFLICGQLCPVFYVHAEETAITNEAKEDVIADDSRDKKAEEKSESEEVDITAQDDTANDHEDDIKTDDADKNPSMSESTAQAVSSIEQNESNPASALTTDVNVSENVLDKATLAGESVQTMPAGENIVDACACPREVNPENDEKNGEEYDDSEETVICPETCPEVLIENVNDAVISNDGETIANTGQNEQYDQIVDNDAHNQVQADEAVQVETGDAASVTIVNNDINTNVITQNGDYLNIDIYGDYVSDINLLEIFHHIISDAQDRSNVISAAITNINNAELTNNVITEAITGANELIGDVDVNTGSATAITDIVNHVNTNIIGENWLFANVNIFGNWIGDLIVPGQGLLTTRSPRVFRDTVIVNENDAHVDNTMVTTADTGNNSSAYSTTIQTGDAISATNVVNVINTNIIKNNWFLLLVNNMGSWNGTLLNWGNDNLSDVLAYDIDSHESIDASPVGALTVYNNNHAHVDNTVETTALTGGNNAGGNITTGNASAVTNIFNMINTNIIGDNWFFGVVNNMGHWQGDIEFAYPDLTISIDDGLDQVSPEQAIDYTIQYKNAGQADCEATTIDLTLPDEISADQTSWDLPGMKAGEEKTLIVHAKVKKTENVESRMHVVAEISTATKEVKLDNNHATDDTSVIHQYDEVADDAAADSISDGDEFMYDDEDVDSEIDIKRISSAGASVIPGDNIQNTIIVENTGDSTIYNILVKDKMLDENNTELVAYSWQIGSMEKGDKILIKYELSVNNPGKKTDIAYATNAKGEDGYGEKVESNKDYNALTILGYASLINFADAAELPVTLEDLQSKPNEYLNAIVDSELQSSDRLPFWIWLMAIVAFYLAIDWSFFPKKNNPSI